MHLAHKLRGTAILLCLVVPTLATAADPTSDAKSAAARWDQTYNSGDMDGLKALYATDAMVIPKGAAVSGAEGIGAFFAGLKAKGFEDHTVKVQSAQMKGDLLLVTGRWAMSGPAEGGAKKAFEGNWVNVLERKGNDWRTVLHTWN